MPGTSLLTLMTPHAAISAADHLRAVQADDVDAAREFAGAEPRMPELLVQLVDRHRRTAPARHGRAGSSLTHPLTTA
ncbi:hypothetical protein ACIRNI_22740 [Streptomyces sp. NPDC093546]|uniref:hypothetical protein n=1 Tax=Streptomyces sp. NPDC093546 TaxID=3366040 RepID=UPI00381376FD